MIKLRIPSVLLLALVLAGCRFTADTDRPVSNLYCDNFLIYDMCAQDSSGNGVVDLVYFDDTKEVFMYRPGAERRVPRNLIMHRCAVAMDEDLVATTSRLFFITDETTMIERTDIRGAMMIKYIAYMPRVTACNMEAEQAAGAGDGA